MSQRVYEFGPYHLDANRCLLQRAGASVALTPKAFDILLALIECHGEIIGKDELMQRVWPDSFVEDGNLTYNISVLRKALGERAGQHQYIMTVPGRGYRFVAAVNEASSAETEAEISALPDASAPHATDINQVNDTTAKRPDRVGRHRWAFAAVAVIIAALIIVGYLFVRRSAQSQVSAVEQPPIRTLAVLPLANGSGDAEMDYLSDGISESLINSLSRLPGLKVIARNSSFKYKGKDADPQEVARALGVEAIVMGRVSQRGDALSISVELMDARDKTQVWGEQYNRRTADLQIVQAEISREIAAKLRVKLTSVEQQQLARRETANPQAYELLLRGHFYARKGGTENRMKGVELFKQALAVDPDYALAYASLSATYGALSNVDPKEFKPKAQAAAQKALALDENLANAHVPMANLHRDDWDWAAAEAEYKRAIELNPNLTRARTEYSDYLVNMGRHEQALVEIERAREPDPLNLHINVSVGYILFLTRRYDEAIMQTKKVLELDKGFIHAYNLLGSIYAAKRQYREAITAYQESNRLGETGPWMQISLGAAYAQAGQRERAQAILRRLQTSKEYVSQAELAVLYTSLGEREQAFAALERAYAAHDPQLQYMGIEVAFDPLRSDPRFQDLLRRVGLAQ